MKTAYFDCFSGASGDMILGALLDAGLEAKALRRELLKLSLPPFQLKINKISKRGISATKVLVTGGEREHRHRNLKDLKTILKKSKLEAGIREKSLAILIRLAEAEARIHNLPVEKVTFHEIGALDTIIDVVGAVAAFTLLEIEKIWVSPFNLGGGTVECAHGTLPVPAPATLELIKGWPAYSGGQKAELLTPTGAAILTTLAQGSGALPAMTVTRTGYGAGTKDLGLPNLLRVIIGEGEAGMEGLELETVAVLQTNIDDMNPQVYDYLIQKALELGALDIFLAPVQMKKNRPGTLVTVVSPPDRLERLAGMLLEETTTIGLRWRLENRIKAARSIEKVKTPFGIIRCKVARARDRIINLSPEYEDLKQAAQKHDRPLKEVMAGVQALLRERFIKA
jgi:uncharacterized protein (TIGR00299 family) protein